MKKINENDKENPICRKVIENAKYNMKKKERPDGYAQNMADELHFILNNLKSNSFVRSVVANSNGKPPGIICFIDKQICLVKSAVCSGNMIGIDRTFNLGTCFVTTMVFQNNTVVRKGTNTSPIMLGPTYLHWDGSYATYCDFLSKIRSVLGYYFLSKKIVFGTDEEIAMVNAIKTSFPQSKHILCT